MSTGNDLRRIASSLEGTTEAPHFDRTAFRAKRIYVTLAADEKTANFMFTPEQQEFSRVQEVAVSGRLRRSLPIAARSSEGFFTEPTAAIVRGGRNRFFRAEEQRAAMKRRT